MRLSDLFRFCECKVKNYFLIEQIFFDNFAIFVVNRYRLGLGYVKGERFDAVPRLTSGGVKTSHLRRFTRHLTLAGVCISPTVRYEGEERNGGSVSGRADQ